MSLLQITPSGRERFFAEDEIIVSKTNAKGIITYANDIFLKIADYEESDVINKPHSLVRHPEMPRSVFKLLWDTIKSGNEIFAYVVNLGKKGDHYWVLAHVTPSFDAQGQVVGYHSNRRVPRRDALDTIQQVYRILMEEERKQSTAKAAAEAGCNLLHKLLQDKGTSYEKFIFSF